MKRVVMCVAVLAFGQAQAGVYKCGNTFSDKPCGKAAQTIEIQHSRPSDADVKRATQATETNKKFIRKSELQSEISRLEMEIRDYDNQMNRELDALKVKKMYSANNLAGATWEQSISTEMQAVISKYNSLISATREKIKQRKEDLAMLN